MTQNPYAWEKCKLESLGKILTGNTPKTKEKENWTIEGEGYIWITPTDIDGLLTSKSARNLTETGWKKSRQLPPNSVLITSIASIGKNTINTVPAAFNQQINAIIPENNDAYFILSAMVNCEQDFAELAGQTAVPIINKTTFSEFEIFTPTLPEQQKIGALFRRLDRLITLHK
ncbi:restriction endonuclease subunit S [Avibacterium sp. 21-586]|uniref:restriction endonuclease subunit S n=1 Tax=Avibacterium sp. 21-586 TaxID=2911534 RepID=UPI002245082B|nr:restriction endonuclease subunit S [Avibacterium sp. 21-586]